MAQWCALRLETERRDRKKFLEEHGIFDAMQLKERVGLRYMTADAYIRGEHVCEGTVSKIYTALTGCGYKATRRYIKVDRAKVAARLKTKHPSLLIMRGKTYLTRYMACQMLRCDELTPRVFAKLCAVTGAKPEELLAEI